MLVPRILRDRQASRLDASRTRQGEHAMRWQPAGRISQERLESQLGRPQQGSIHAQRGWGHSDKLAWRRERASAELLLERHAHERIDPAKEATKDDEPRVEHVHEAGQADAK